MSATAGAPAVADADTGPRVTTLVTADVLDPGEALRAVADPGAGGTCVFCGTVRDHAEGRPVDGLEYEVWEERAGAVLRDVADAIAAEHPQTRALYAAHRSGALTVGEVSVVVAASAPHRAAAFAAARALIDTVKERLPVWKREHFSDGGTRWVGDPGGAGADAERVPVPE